MEDNLIQISGIIVDNLTNLPIKGAQINYDTQLSFSNSDGYFQIHIPLTNDNLTNLTIYSPEYESFIETPYKGDNTPKYDLGIIQLQSTKISLESDKISVSQLTEKQIDILSSDKKDFKFFTQKKLNDSINNVKNRLLPVILTLIAEFGITGVQKLIEDEKNKTLDILKNSKCPTQPQLILLINKKNNLVKQLNQLLNVIDSTTKALGVSGGIIEALNITYQILKNLPIPSAVAGVGVPISVINNIQDNKVDLDKLITGLRNINIGTLTTLILLRQVLSQALQLLNLLDQLVQKCYPDAEQEQISKELTALVTQQSNQTSPLVTNVNGFEMGVVTEVTDKPLKRRRAIAKNKQGVIMLQGELSFSSIDQILIDELVFYIQQNNLKAE